MLTAFAGKVNAARLKQLLAQAKRRFCVSAPPIAKTFAFGMRVNLINNCAWQNDAFAKVHPICRMLTAFAERVNLRHFIICVPLKMPQREKIPPFGLHRRRVVFLFAENRRRQLAEIFASFFNMPAQTALRAPPFCRSRRTFRRVRPRRARARWRPSVP